MITNFVQNCSTVHCDQIYFTEKQIESKLSLKLCRSCRLVHNNELKKKSLNNKRCADSASALSDLEQKAKESIKLSNLEHQLLQSNSKRIKLEEEVEELNLQQVALSLKYERQLYCGASKLKTEAGLSPGKGLFTNINIEDGHRFVTFNGKLVNNESLGALTFRQRQYMLHVTNDLSLDCSNTSLLGCCKASMANCPIRLYSAPKVKATANSKLFVNRREVYLKSIRIIDPGEEIVFNYGNSFQIKNCPLCAVVLHEKNYGVFSCKRKHLLCKKCLKNTPTCSTCPV